MLKKGIRQLTMLSVKTNFHEILLRGKNTYLFFYSDDNINQKQTDSLTQSYKEGIAEQHHVF